MSPAMVGIIGFCLFFVLIFLNMPIGFVMALIGFVGFGLIRGFDPAMALLSVQTYRTASEFILGAIPLFIAMGFLAMHLGLSTDLFYVMNKWIGQLRGGLAMAATGACSIFAAICGDAVATAASVGVVALPQMRKNKYADVLSTGVLASAGNLGFLIPPSLALLIYAVITEQSIGTLFAAGILRTAPCRLFRDNNLAMVPDKSQAKYRGAPGQLGRTVQITSLRFRKFFSDCASTWRYLWRDIYSDRSGCNRSFWSTPHWFHLPAPDMAGLYGWYQ